MNMKLKKLALVIILTLLAIILTSAFNIAKAAISTTPRYFTIRQLRSTGYRLSCTIKQKYMENCRGK